MTYQNLRAKYPKFIYESFSTDGNTLTFEYSISEHHFTHKVTFENIQNLKFDAQLVFNLGMAEIFSYWKLTCSPVIEIRAGHLSDDQIKFWEKLLIKGMGQYFYENKINFTQKDFLKIKSMGKLFENCELKIENSRVLVPLGGGKDSIVTAELLKPHFKIQPIIVYPATPASIRISKIITDTPPIIVHRILDPHMIELTNQGHLTGHVPYSAILAFLFLIPGYKYIAVSHERSSEEGNVEYLGHSINHQYSKTFEFETDFNKYLRTINITPLSLPLKLRGGNPKGEGDIKYFSFLRSLYELQISKLFSQMPRYFNEFRSCNKNQQQNSWCGHCPKCVSTALLLKPFLSKDKIIEIIGSYPPDDPANPDLRIIKPFECILTLAEATATYSGKGLDKILSSWQDNPNMPKEFTKILKDAYENS